MSVKQNHWTVDTSLASIPQTAHCERCGETWHRPQQDRYAHSLEALIDFHECPKAS